MTRFALALLACTGLVSAVGCGYAHDSAAYFPESWETDYVELHACRTSAHPRGGYVRVVMSPDAKDAWCAGQDLPDDTVIVKEQWDDNVACPPGQQDIFTVMKKIPGGWHWQTVGGDGSVLHSGPQNGCQSCHEGTEDGQFGCPGAFCTSRDLLADTASLTCP